MKRNLFILILLLTAYQAFPQTYMTRNGSVSFYSKTPLENIEASNKQLYAIIDADKKNLAFTVLLKGFLFEKELMQTHFNEKYVESDKYPKASFTGSYTGHVDASKNGSYPVIVAGKLTLHGVTRHIETPATLVVKDGSLTGECSLSLNPGDYNIDIPSLVREKIANEISVFISANCTKR